MSAVLLVPSCQPTVLRLRPFSSNNACQDPQAARADATSGRGFPVLAVTRSSRLRPRYGSTNQGTQPLQRVMSERSPRKPERELASSYRKSQRARSEYLDRSHAHDATLEVYRSVPDTFDGEDGTEFNHATGYVDLRESFKGHDDRPGYGEPVDSLTFSDDLINAVVPSSTNSSTVKAVSQSNPVPTNTASHVTACPDVRSSDVSTHVTNSVTSTSVNTVTSGTAMARPVIKTPPLKHTDKRYYLPQNGIWRAVTFTPGEVDLNRFAHKAVGEAVAREAAAREAGSRDDHDARRSRYKLNANQIPRSSTPVQENDPDKLNMRQVIAFLQSRGRKVSSQPTRQQIRQSRIASVDIGQPRPEVGGAGAMDLALRPSKGTQRAPNAPSSSSPSAPQRARVPHVPQPLSVVTYSGMPLRSSPPLVRRAARSSGRDDMASHVMREEVRTLVPQEEGAGSDKGSSSMASSSFKAVRQFRLHRFLSAAPGTAEVKSALNGREGSPANYRGGKSVAFAEQPSIIPPSSSSPSPPALDSQGSATQTGRGGQEQRVSYRYGKRSETDVIRRRLPARVQSGNLPAKNRRQRLKSAPPAVVDGVIRLPSMGDPHPDSDHDSEREDQTTPGPEPYPQECEATPDGEELPESEMELLRSFDPHAKPLPTPSAGGRRDPRDASPTRIKAAARPNPTAGSRRRSSSEGTESRRSETSISAAATITLQRLSSQDGSRRTPEDAPPSRSPAEEEAVASPSMRPSAVVSPVSGRRRSSATSSLMSAYSPRKLQVRLPRDQAAAASKDTPRTPDIVKLSLRKERTRTREHTYMTDIADDSPRPAWELEGKMVPVTTCDAQTAVSPRPDVVHNGGLS